MCDTLGKIISVNKALFAKNSDRSPNEPQVIEYRPTKDYDSDAMIQATYISIPQVNHTYATLLSRPVWMWGAEMGVNEHGVCIGNEAVFTKGAYNKEGNLIGMDLLRLGLERGASAKEAMDVIIRLLQEYGQGGNCGYDHKFYYDNAFLIMDRQEIYLLETAGKEWVYKKVETGSLSNRLQLRADGTAYRSATPYDFAGRHLEPLYSHFSGSKKRLAQTSCKLSSVASVADMMTALRTHRHEEAPLTCNDVASTCMHAGGAVGDHTTSSMIVELGEEITVWVTGSSTPCISVFKPWTWGSEITAPVFSANQTEIANAYWHFHESFARKAIGHILPEEFYIERNALEEKWLNGADYSVKEEEAFYQKWLTVDFGPSKGKKNFLAYWEKKNEALKTPERNIVTGD